MVGTSSWGSWNGHWVVKLWSCEVVAAICCHIIPWRWFAWFADFWDGLFNHEPPTRHHWSIVSTPSLSKDSAIRKLNGSDGLDEAGTSTSDKMETWNDRGTLSAVSSQGSFTPKGMQVFKRINIMNVMFLFLARLIGYSNMIIIWKLYRELSPRDTRRD